MKRSTQSLLAAGLFVLAIALSQSSAQAQFRSNPYVNAVRMQIAQQQMYQQQMFYNRQAQVQNFAYYGIPVGSSYYSNPANNPYNYGNYYGQYYPPATPYYPPANPYVASPYVPTAPGYGVGSNPYSAVDPALANPYNPYGSYGAGSALSGAADLTRAYGQNLNAIEQARITRERALQAKLDTKKQKFDLEMYIKRNTPSYTEEQEQVAKLTLRRIQNNSLPGEVAGGKSLNYLLDDLRKFPNKKISLEPIILNEEVLAHLNMTKRTYGIGLLRDNGKVTFPGAVEDRMTAEQKKGLEKQLQTLVKEAYANRIDRNLLKEVNAEIDRIRDELVKKVNEVPTGQYLDAKRFLNELSEGATALGQGEALNQAKYQRFLEEGKGNRSVQQIADFMIDEGLRFGPATSLDEAAYRAVHAAMASYDIAMNTQFNTDVKE